MPEREVNAEKEVGLGKNQGCLVALILIGSLLAGQAIIPIFANSDNQGEKKYR
ncbi:MAG: hypothetical protein F6K40_26020 [Okeania sp. SIO3I5]|uniref:hypothetical protein n=1 Tax=Okeania sp. SIO3I5 TaxID=2607805 RepID=UPI0013B9BD31|nr:hypothetical protein [Okeania sp. SIO3I5]NEQ39526.1 hypothetical protein [Okeania sp. SIO3I5]